MPKLLRDGSKVSFEYSFTHVGEACPGAGIHVAIGYKRTILGVTNFEEVFAGNVAAPTIVATSTPKVYSGIVDLQLGSNVVLEWTANGLLLSNLGQAYMKLTGIPGADVFVWGPVGEFQVVQNATFSGFSFNTTVA